MSQDMFASDPDEPTEGLVLTPLEFSGVSGGSSPSQQKRPQTQNEPAVPEPPRLEAVPCPSTSSGQHKEYICSHCKKKPYKTFRGFQKHMSEKHGIVVTDSNDPGPSRVQTTTATATTRNTQKETFKCPECSSTLETKRGFLTHRAAHRIKEINLRKPNASQFKEEALIQTMDKIVEELLTEPAYDERKANILQEFVNKKNTEEWNLFVLYLTDNICGFVCDDKQSKLFPMNQYEVSQTKLNALLNNENSKLRDMFLAVVNADNFFVNRLIFRIASKLLSHIQIWVVRKMSSIMEETPAGEAEDMSELEETNFTHDLGRFLRKRFKKYRKRRDEYCACIRATFVDGEHPISTFDFLNEKNWFSCEEKCIEPSQRTVQFFKAIEMSIRQSKEITSAEQIIEIIFKRTSLLDHWFYLTNAHISEQDSLVFMRDLVHHFLETSLLAEEKRRNREEEQTIQANTVPIRTNLLRNFAEKDDAGESVD